MSDADLIVRKPSRFLFFLHFETDDTDAGLQNFGYLRLGGLEHLGRLGLRHLIHHLPHHKLLCVVEMPLHDPFGPLVQDVAVDTLVQVLRLIQRVIAL